MGPSPYRELRCPACGWSEPCGPTRMAIRLRKAGKLRPDREPEPEILWELLRQAAGHWTCPDCGATGLAAVARDENDEDWPGPRPCQGCGKPIPPERLEAIPGATLCAGCQQREEQGLATGETEYCPRCGAPMTPRLARSSGITRYVMACTNNPPCRGVG